jgi:hypothetical protein
MKIAFLWMLLILAACSTSTSSESSDSTVVTEDAIAVEADYPEGEQATSELDTTITETLEVLSSFDAPQIKPTVAYVYYEEGANVYEKNVWPFDSDALVIGGIDYKGTVTLLEPLINNLPTDTMTISGLKGRMIGIDYKGKTGFIFSGFLLNLPVPEDGLSPVEYFSTHLHMVEPAVNIRHECNDCDGISSETTYHYEQGITVTDNSYYESYDRSAYFGENVTLQEVFLFARAFYGFLRQDFVEFPLKPVHEEFDEGRSKEAAWENGRIVRIISVTGQGCYEEEGVHIENGRVKMSANGGC